MEIDLTFATAILIVAKTTVFRPAQWLSHGSIEASHVFGPHHDIHTIIGEVKLSNNISEAGFSDAV